MSEPGRSWLRSTWWKVGREATFLLMWLLYRMRVHHQERVPRQGPVVFISNHQSFFDPIINGAAVAPRAFTPLARQTLFRFKPFAWLIRSFGAVPIAGDNTDAAAVRLAIAEIAAGRTVLLYPEGKRSADGRLNRFQRGFLLLLRRSEAAVVPIGIEGAFDAWPRTRKAPRWSGRIDVVIGEPMRSSDLVAMPPEEALRRCELAIDQLRLEGRAAIRARTGGRWPAPGVADAPSFGEGPEASS